MAISLVIHIVLVAYAYKAGVLESDDIANAPSNIISVYLVDPRPYIPSLPAQLPKPVEKRKVATRAPSTTRVSQEPKIIKKEVEILPPKAEIKATSSPLPSPVSQPAVFSTLQPTYQPKPRYPSIAKRRGIEGSVIFEISVANDGLVNNVIIIQSSGSSTLDNAASKTIKTWRFPASQFNSLSNFKQKIEFRLNRN